MEQADLDASDYTADCRQRITDCRFKKVKMLGPILKELELPEAYGNYVSHIEPGCGKVHVVGTEQPQLNFSSDAVKAAYPPQFHEELMVKVAKRMSPEGPSAPFEHTAITINDDLVENIQLLTRLLAPLPYKPKMRYALSGSEAVEVALKDVRYSTNKKYIVRFKGAYHGHTSAVSNFDELGPDAGHFIYLKEMDPKSLDFIEKYHYKIAGVMINPMQYFTGLNKVSPTGEKMNIGKRTRGFDLDSKNAAGTCSVSHREYAQWLHDLNDKTSYVSKYLTPVAFILDDIYFAFRHEQLFSHRFFALPTLGAGEAGNKPNQYTPLEPDVIILGKGVAGGYPLSIVCGSPEFMMKRDTNYLLRVNRSVGTLSAWPRGVAACNVFLRQLLPQVFDGNNGWGSQQNQIEAPSKDWRKHLQLSNQRFAAFTVATNKAFSEAKLPLRLRSFCNTFSIDYLNDSFYNSLYTQYLIANDVFLTNQSTGKFNLWCSITDTELLELTRTMVKAGQEMQEGGFFQPKGGLLRGADGSFSRRFCTLTVLSKFFISWCYLQYQQIMLDKEIDIEVSHNHPVNKCGHFWSSVLMIIFMYPAMYLGELRLAFFVFLATHAVRQSGHFFYEKQDTDWEKQKFGHKDGSKKMAVLFIIFVVMTYYFCYVQPVDWPGIAASHGGKGPIGLVATYLAALQAYMSNEQFCTLTGLMTITPHFLEIVHYYGPIRGVQWILKIFTDPFTDIPDFYKHSVIHPKHFLDLRQQRHVKYSLGKTFDGGCVCFLQLGV